MRSDPRRADCAQAFIEGSATWFYIPDLDIQAASFPSQSTQVPLQIDRPGEYGFLCDIFCGDRHGERTGVIKVITEILLYGYLR